LLLVDEFKNWLIKEKKITKSSSEVYLVSVRYFLKYYETYYSKDFNKLEIDIVNGYALKLKLDDKIPAATINSKMTGLKKFNQFLVEMGYQKEIVVERNHRVEPDAPGTEDEYAISTYEVEKFLTAVRTAHNQRDLALIMLIMKTNLLISEIVDMKITDYHNGVISITDRKSQKKNYHVDNELKTILEGYVQDRTNKYYSQSKYLFISNKSGKMDKRHIYHLFTVYSKKAMLNMHITPGKLSGFHTPQEEPSRADFEYTLNERIRMDINVFPLDTLNNCIAKIEVIVDFKGNQKVFVFGAAFPGYIRNIVKNGKGFYPKGIIIIESLKKNIIKDIILDSFYMPNQSFLSFLNELEVHSLSQEEFNNIVRGIVIS
jgi:integrase/recombinase XerD